MDNNNNGDKDSKGDRAEVEQDVLRKGNIEEFLIHYIESRDERRNEDRRLLLTLAKKLLDSSKHCEKIKNNSVEMEEDNSEDNKECKKRCRWKDVKKKRRRRQRQSSLADADSGCHSFSSASTESNTISDEEKEEQIRKPKESRAKLQLENFDSNQLTCLTCKRKFANKQNLRRHLRLHIKRDTEMSDDTNENDKRSDKSGDVYRCDWCPEQFSNRSAYRLHLSLHAQLTEHACYLCDKKYADKYALRYHLSAVHCVGKHFMCNFCGKNFGKASRLAAHVAAVHNSGPDTKTPQNNQGFSNKKDEIDGNRAKCDEEKSGNVENGVKIAINTARGASERQAVDASSGSKTRPSNFLCRTCGRGFRHKSSLVIHERSRHSLSRPYCCEFCGKTFVEAATFRTHMRVHTGEKPYVCTLCTPNKRYSQRAGLNYHRRVVHGAQRLPDGQEGERGQDQPRLQDGERVQDGGRVQRLPEAQRLPDVHRVQDVSQVPRVHGHHGAERVPDGQGLHQGVFGAYETQCLPSPPLQSDESYLCLTYDASNAGNTLLPSFTHLRTSTANTTTPPLTPNNEMADFGYHGYHHHCYAHHHEQDYFEYYERGNNFYYGQQYNEYADFGLTETDSNVNPSCA